MNQGSATPRRPILICIDHIQLQIAHELGYSVTATDARLYLQSLGLTVVDDHWAEMHMAQSFSRLAPEPDDQQPAELGRA